MSKSLDNAIFLSDDSLTVEKKVKKMYTDPNRLTAEMPGTVEGNPVFIYHDAFNKNKLEVEELKDRYRKGKVGDSEVKNKLANAINEFLNPVREKREHYLSQSGLIDEIIYKGTLKTREEVKKNVYEMRKAMGFSTVWSKFKKKAEDFNKKSN
jgi:tryptophanyl-tRNA synthetase